MNWLQAEILIIGPKPYQSTRFLYTIDNSPIDPSRESQTWMNNFKFIINRGEKLHEVWIIVGDSRLRKLDFPNIWNLFHRLSKYIYNDYLLAKLLIPSLDILANEGGFSRRRRRVSHLFCSTSLKYFFLAKQH